jgi:hypothetical protein
VDTMYLNLDIPAASFASLLGCLRIKNGKFFNLAVFYITIYKLNFANYFYQGMISFHQRVNEKIAVTALGLPSIVI